MKPALIRAAVCAAAILASAAPVSAATPAQRIVAGVPIVEVDGGSITCVGAR